MTRKDYILLAYHLRFAVPTDPSHRAGFDAAVRAIADAFKQDNARFERDRFIKAVYEGGPEPRRRNPGGRRNPDSDEPEWPTVKDVFDELWAIDLSDLGQVDEGDSLEVRLQVTDDEGWTIHTGDPSYDTDHRGWWGAGYLNPGMTRADVREVAADLIDEARDEWATVNG